jgi:hypothetical protein
MLRTCAGAGLANMMYMAPTMGACLELRYASQQVYRNTVGARW